MKKKQHDRFYEFFRWLPDFKGKQRLGRLLLRNKIKNFENLVVTGKYGINYLLPNLKEIISFEIVECPKINSSNLFPKSQLFQ